MISRPRDLERVPRGLALAPIVLLVGPRQAGKTTHGLLIRFDEPVHGPIAIGASSHFSLGLFVAETT